MPEREYQNKAKTDRYKHCGIRNGRIAYRDLCHTIDTRPVTRTLYKRSGAYYIQHDNMMLPVVFDGVCFTMTLMVEHGTAEVLPRER